MSTHRSGVRASRAPRDFHGRDGASRSRGWSARSPDSGPWRREVPWREERITAVEDRLVSLAHRLGQRLTDEPTRAGTRGRTNDEVVRRSTAVWGRTEVGRSSIA